MEQYDFTMKEPLLIVLVGLFIIVLVFRLIRGLLVGRRLKSKDPSVPGWTDPQLSNLIDGAKRPTLVREAIREIGRRAPGVESAELRAEYRCAAGYLSLNQLKRPGLAVGFYLRALREDPTSIEALDKLQEILTAQKRFRRLEWTYWDVLGRLDDAEVGSEMWGKCWAGLAAVYSSSPRTVRRADAIRKALVEFTHDDTEEPGDMPRVPKVVS